MKEADVVLVGGHSVEDKELKYGLSVTGFIHPNRVLTKKAMEPGDQLILTKSLGTANKINVARATILALSKLRNPAIEVARRKGIPRDEEEVTNG